MRLQSHRCHRLQKRLLRLGMAVGIGLCLLVGIPLARQLYQAAQQPVQATLVLGGSIRREMWIAQQPRHPDGPPVLISQGSADPCIRLLFERYGRPLTGVWLERCAQSTFENYLYALPFLQDWQVQHVRVVTSGSHLPRAQWLGQIMLGSHGIWVEMITVQETGVPGNQEFAFKTLLDVTRALGWSVISQAYQPRCSALMPLPTVDLETWQRRGFQCEHQAGL